MARKTFATLFCGLLPLSGWGLSLSLPGGSFRAATVTVTGSSQSLESAPYTFTVSNPVVVSGWTLTGAVSGGVLSGQVSLETIALAYRFDAIRWVSGGSGSTTGINISSDDQMITAGFGAGLGVYEADLIFEVEVPAFPRADTYQTTVTLTLTAL